MENFAESRFISISIRTPAWGVTRLIGWRCNHKPDFNSHPPVGGDARFQPAGRAQKISIRTPAWGVTCARSAVISLFRFQFAPPRGG